MAAPATPTARPRPRRAPAQPSTRATPAQRAPRPARPPLRVVSPEIAAEARRRRLVRRAAAAASVLVALCVFGVVVAHVQLTQNQFRLDQLREQSAARQADYDRLRLQVAELESPERIVATAQTRLGMVTPPAITYLAPSIDSSAPAPEEISDGTTALRTPTSWSTVKPHLAES